MRARARAMARVRARARVRVRKSYRGECRASGLPRTGRDAGPYLEAGATPLPTCPLAHVSPVFW